LSLLKQYQEKYFRKFLNEFDKTVNDLFPDKISDLKDIFRYHLGLNDDPEKQGKRIRPLLTFLCTEGCGGIWESAIPAAIAIELIHNFSLIHDDIEDNGMSRRSKQTVWVKWGLARGINSGDAMFTSAFIALNKLEHKILSESLIDAYKLLSDTCLQLTIGQQLDIEFETRENITIADYYRMISGKTAALLSCCTQMGALISGLGLEDQMCYSKFGNEIGLAFQIYDDWLGIWGDPMVTGKSASSDLVEGKKSLPILIGLEKSKRFQERWLRKAITQDESATLAEWLCEDKVEESVMKEFRNWNCRALDTLSSLRCDKDIRSALFELAEKLLMRNR